jgi:hypothetical protein
MAAVPPVVVPVVVEFTTDDAEMLTAAVELLADIREHLPHRAVFDSAARIGSVAEALARIAERIDP